MASWLRANGRAFIEIYTPWYWSKVAGIQYEWSDVSRRYDFDPDQSRMLDIWWETGHPEDSATQSLRCYSPDELQILLSETAFTLVKLLPGGSYDHDTQTYRPVVGLDEAMQYMAVLAIDRARSRA